MQSNALDKKVRIAPKTFLFFAFFHFPILPHWKFDRMLSKRFASCLQIDFVNTLATIGRIFVGL